MTPEVIQAIEQIRAAFPECGVTAEPEAQGGAHVTVTGVNLGESYSPFITWMGFLISFQYPRADVYPHFTDPALKRVDGRALGEAMSLQPQAWRGSPAVQISRRSNRLDPATDTAATKLAKVIEWVRTR